MTTYLNQRLQDLALAQLATLAAALSALALLRP